VSKHTTCDDVDEDGVKRLVKVPRCRCCRRDVDVGAVLLGTNKERKNQNPNTHVNAQKFEAKRTHKCCQSLCQDNAGFYVKGTNGCQKRDYGVKTKSKVSVKWCWTKYTGFSRSPNQLFPVRRCTMELVGSDGQGRGACDAWRR
jgi:hypothetical protein